MLSFYAAKGGVGCSVVAATVASLASRTEQTLLVDLVGDQSALFGLDTSGPGLSDWFCASTPLPDALSRLEIPIDDRLSLITPGFDPHDGTVSRPGDPSDYETLARLLKLEGRRVVMDVGMFAGHARSVLGASTTAILVTRACYLAVRAARSLVPPDEVVLISEPGRALRSTDLAACFGTSIDVVLPWDPAVARMVDAGLLPTRLPRSLLGLKALL